MPCGYQIHTTKVAYRSKHAFITVLILIKAEWVNEWLGERVRERHCKLINIRLHTIMWCITYCLTPIFKSISIYILICVLKLCKQLVLPEQKLLSSSWLISEPPVSSGVYRLDFSSASFVLSTKKSTVSALKWPAFLILAEHQACYCTRITKSTSACIHLFISTFILSDNVIIEVNVQT